MKKILVFFLGFIILGCSNQVNDEVQLSEIKLSKSVEIAKNYLEDKGYNIVSYEGNVRYFLQNLI